MITQRDRAWRRQQQRRVVNNTQHSHLWLWNQLFVARQKPLNPTSEHLKNPKKTQLQKLHGHIQAVKERLRGNEDFVEG